MQRWTRITHGVTHRLGSAAAFAALGVLFLVWLTWGVISGFPRSWELAVTVGFPWVTVALLMVIQHTHNRDARASHLKQNELLLSRGEADHGVIDAELRADPEQHDLRDEHHRRGREQVRR